MSLRQAGNRWLVSRSLGEGWRLFSTFPQTSQRNRPFARTSFKFGEASLLDVLDAQRVLWQTFQAYAQARFELSVALTELERLVGKEL